MRTNARIPATGDKTTTSHALLLLLDMHTHIFEHYKDETEVCLETCNGQTMPCTIPTTST